MLYIPSSFHCNVCLATSVLSVSHKCFSPVCERAVKRSVDLSGLLDFCGYPVRSSSRDVPFLWGTFWAETVVTFLKGAQILGTVQGFLKLERFYSVILRTHSRVLGRV